MDVPHLMKGGIGFHLSFASCLAVVCRQFYIALLVGSFLPGYRGVQFFYSNYFLVFSCQVAEVYGFFKSCFLSLISVLFTFPSIFSLLVLSIFNFFAFLFRTITYENRLCFGVNWDGIVDWGWLFHRFGDGKRQVLICCSEI